MLHISEARLYPIKRLIAFAFIMSFSLLAFAQTPLVPYSWKLTSQISPYYFGPCAFPVPYMVDGSNQDDISVEMSTNNFFGKAGDHDFVISPKVTYPLFNPRLNMAVWGHMCEWYNNTDQRLKEMRLDTLANTNPKARKGVMVGDVYISTNIQVMVEDKYHPGMVLRAVLKTASGNGYDIARFYDAPGYFFDITAGKSMYRGDHELRAAVSGGFLCWQTSAGRQNDAIMFGLLLRWKYKGLSLTESISGYSGWEHRDCIPAELAHDQPVEFMSQLSYRIKKWEIIAGYQVGVRDYPFQQLQLGAAYHITWKNKPVKTE